jgi:hypothetical protein
MDQAVLSPGARHRWVRRLAAVVLPLVLLNGCSSMSNSETGALAGGTVGAVGGGVIGHALHNTAAGAVIGGAVGAVTGAIVGDHKDQKEAAQAYSAARQTTFNDVIQLTHDHVGDVIIINRVRESGVVFRLTAAEIETLKANGVSDVVITEMQANRTVRVYAQPTVIVAEPPPPPPSVPVSVGVGVGFR